MFLLDLAKVHKMYLRSFVVDTVQMTLDDLECLCSMFPYLEELSCSIAFCRGSVSLHFGVDIVDIIC